MRSLPLFFLVAFSLTLANCAPPEETTVDATIPPPASVTIEGNLAESGVLTAVAKLPATAPKGAKLAFAWFVNKEAVANAGAAKLEGEFFAKDDVVEVEARVAVGKASSEPVRSKPVTIGNTKPVATVAFDAELYRTDDTIVVLATGDDDDGDEVTFTYAWLINGTAASGDPGASLPGAAFEKGDLVEVAVTPHDGTVDGDVARMSVTIQNSAPAVTSAGLTPSAVYTTTDLSATTGASADADGDTVSFLYRWFVDGAAVAATGATLPSTQYAKGQAVQVEVTPFDGALAGAAVRSASTTILNTAPVIAGVTLAAGPFTTASGITIASIVRSDADGDAVTYGYQWYADGAPLVGATLNILPGGTVSKSTVVKVLVTPTDGSNAGLPVFSQNVTVQNAAPEISLSIGGGPFTTNSTLSVAPITFDSDGDFVSVSYAWRVNGNAAGADSASLAGSAFSKHDKVWVLATPYDGLAYGSPVSAAAVTIQNSAPSIVSAALAAGPVTTAGTVAFDSASGWSDADGDAAGYTYAWYVDGSSVSGQTGNSLPGAFFSKGQQVYSLVTPFDGELAGAAVQTGSITIQNTPPLLSAVSLASAGTRFARNHAINAVATSSDADGDSRSYTYAWYVNGAVSGQTGAAFPALTAVYGDSVTVFVQASDGTALSGWVASPAAVLQNALAEAPTVTLFPAKPAETAALMYATHAGPALDADGDSVSYTYEWTKNGGLYASGVTQVSGPFSKRDDWVVSVKPHDGSEFGTPGTASTFIHEKVTAISGGGNFTCWLTNHGDVRCSGKNDGGVLGLAADGASYFAPQLISGFPLPVSKLAAGQKHVCATVTDGRVYCWGDNSWGQLGQSSATLANSATPVYVAGTTDAVEVGTGDGFSCYSKSDTVWCWGRDDLGQLGDNVNAANNSEPTPKQVVGITYTLAQLVVAGGHACVLQADGQMKCWGNNQNCVLGLDPQVFGWQDRAVPTTVFGIYNPTQIAAGDNLTCVWTYNGGFLCLGDGGSVGHNTTNACDYGPGNVNAFPFGQPVPVSVSLGRTANCGLMADGSVRCWTSAGFDTYSPGASSIAASNDSFCALDGTGASTCFLENTYGEHGAVGGFSSTGQSTIGFGGY